VTGRVSSRRPGLGKVGKTSMTTPRKSLPKRVRGRLNSYRLRAEALVQRRWRRALVMAARDCTPHTAARSCLVVAAHPDDETFGCAATIARKTSAGTPVKVFIASDGRHANPGSRKLTAEQLGTVRRREAAEVCEILGVPAESLVQAGLAHLRSAEAVDEVTRLLAEIIDEFSPAEILVNSALDYHPDHKILNRIVRRLVIDKGYRGWVAEYPVWYLFDGPWPADRQALASRPTVEEAAPDPGGWVFEGWRRLTEPAMSVARLRPCKIASGPFLERKRQAVAAYRSQITNFTGEQEWNFLGPEFVNIFLQPQEIFFPNRRWPSRRTD
jgi:LmbE family N-acetylglucosaminyl deacetylase